MDACEEKNAHVQAIAQRSNLLPASDFITNEYRGGKTADSLQDSLCLRASTENVAALPHVKLRHTSPRTGQFPALINQSNFSHQPCFSIGEHPCQLTQQRGFSACRRTRHKQTAFSHLGEMVQHLRAQPGQARARRRFSEEISRMPVILPSLTTVVPATPTLWPPRSVRNPSRSSS